MNHGVPSLKPMELAWGTKNRLPRKDGVRTEQACGIKNQLAPEDGVGTVAVNLPTRLIAHSSSVLVHILYSQSVHVFSSLLPRSRPFICISSPLLRSQSNLCAIFDDVSAAVFASAAFFVPSNAPDAVSLAPSKMLSVPLSTLSSCLLLKRT